MIKDLKISKSQQRNQRWSFNNPFNSTKTETQDDFYDNDINYRELNPSNKTSTGIDRKEVTAEFASTGNPLDLAISGEGFFQVQLPNGEKAYTRDGMWKIGDDGRLVTSEGYAMTPDIFIPGDALTVNIAPDGKVKAIIIGCDSTIEISQVRIAKIENSNCLSLIGRNLWTASKGSGQVSLEIPGKGDLGRIEQGFLELNEVNVIEETTNMMTALKCHEMLSKTNIQIETELIPEAYIG